MAEVCSLEKWWVSNYKSDILTLPKTLFSIAEILTMVIVLLFATVH